MVIGRGGQGLLAYFSWQAFVRYVTTSMEVQPVTFNTYRMIFLQNESLILGIPRLIRDFCKRRSLHSKFAMVFMILTMIFILAFPTLGSAMTGYSGNVIPYVPDLDENFLPFHDFSIVLYTIHDGSRINKTDDYHVTIYKRPEDNDDPRLSDIEDWKPSGAYSSSDIGADCAEYPEGPWQDRCASSNMIGNISQYIGIYGTSPQAGKSSIFNGATVDAPTLKISAYDLPDILNNTQSGATPLKPNTGHSAMFVSNNKLYNQTYIQDKGKCQAQKSYKWGFSFVQLNIMIILLLVWTFGIIIMYVSSKFTRLQRGREDVAGEYKAVFELSDAMHAQLDTLEEEDGKEIRQITEPTLRRRVTKDLRGGSIAYDTTLLSKGDDWSGGLDWTLKAWALREIWWFVGLVIAITIDGFVIRRFFIDYDNGVRDDLWFFPALPLAIGFAMYVGLTHGSRVMVLSWAMLVMCVLPAIVLKMAL
ncbi:hypothetical protein SVAN01_07548 [Stagonosporopsis vannaccii]|nr:hypothetical protein SVAN01_07548 [Stagonosporopsis vannaccii]